MAKNLNNEVYNDIINNNNTAVLILEDNTILYGSGYGKPGFRVGEICFNTSMTGYQEILTDPSYKSQIIVFTFPHIGNVGTNHQDIESKCCFASGIVTRESITESSNWRSEDDFKNWTKKMNLPGISGIDTRALTKLIRLNKAPKGIICYDPFKHFDIPKLKKEIKNWNGLNNLDLVTKVTSKNIYEWDKKIWKINNQSNSLLKESKLHVVVIDFGIKFNILRNLYEIGLKVTVVPSNINFKELIKLKPDGIILSNGPGDPKATYKNLTLNVLELSNIDIPIFGICIGHQILALALGAKTEKMTQGHRGGNHPVLNLKNQTVEITSQNHGFKVVEKGFPKELNITHKSLFDGSIEGFEHRVKKLFAVQYHPESSPGPHDSKYLFEKFLLLIKENKREYA